jgi:hypothetical protein
MFIENVELNLLNISTIPQCNGLPCEVVGSLSREVFKEAVDHWQECCKRGLTKPGFFRPV